MTYPTGDAELTFGKVQYAWTEAAHVHISTSNGSYVTVRGVQYHIGLHLFLIDGVWRIRDRHDLYTNRSIVDRNYNKPVSDSARKVILEQCTAFWLGFVSANPTLGNVAERVHLQANLDRLDEDIIELQGKIDHKQTLRRMSADRLAAL